MKLKSSYKYFFLSFFAFLSGILFPICSLSQTPINNQQRVPPLRDRLSNNPELKQFFHPIPSLSTVTPSTVNKTMAGCDTWTFQLKLGNATSVEKVNDMLQLPNGDYIIVGTYSTGSAENGLLVKLDRQGNLIWSKFLEQSTYDINIKKIKLFSDGLLYAMLEIKPIATTITTPVLCCFDQNGNLLWSDRMNVTGLAGSWKGIDLGEWRENSFSVVISNDSLLNVTKFSSSNRSTIWSKTYKSRGNPGVVGIGNEYWQTFVVYNEIDSGYKRSAILELDYTTGNIRSNSSIGGIDGTDIFLESMRMIKGRPRLTGYQHRNGNYEFLKLVYNYNPNVGAEVFSVVGLPYSNQLLSAQDDWTQKLGVSNSSNPTEVYLLSTFPDNSNSPISANKVSYAYPVELRNMTRAWDGGALIASNSLDAQADIVLTKVDSAATLPGCSSTPSSASFILKTIPGFAPPMPQLTNTTVVNPIAIGSQPLNLQTTIECQTNYCPTINEPDSCLRTFFKEYRNTSMCSIMENVLKTNQNEIMASGRGRANPYAVADDHYVVLFDTTGKLIDQRIFRSNGGVGLNSIIKLKDGNYIAAGWLFGTNADMFLSKFDDQFNVAWSKKITPASPLGPITQIIESLEGDFYCVVAGSRTSTGEKNYLIKLSSTGDPIWFKQYNAGPDNFPGFWNGGATIVEFGPHIYLEYEEGETGDRSPHLLKLNKSDGAVVWAKKIPVPDASYWQAENMLTDKTNLYLFGGDNPVYSFIKLSPDGTIISSMRIGTPQLHLAEVKQKTDTSFILSVNRYTYPNVVYGAVEIDTAFKTLHDQFVQIPKSGGTYDMAPFSDSVTYAVGTFFYPDDYLYNVYLQKFNFSGSYGSCQVTNLALNLQHYPVNVINETNAAQNLSLPTSTTVPLQMEPYDLAYSGFFCGKTACNFLDLDGPSTICDSVNTYDFRITKNQDCDAPTNWVIDTSINQVKIISLSDSLLRVKIIGNGNFKIKSRIFASCDWIEDSIMVSAGISAVALNLGPDTIICPGNTVLLNARSGFTSYRWQDGSTDSIYLATQPGTYFVEVSSGCSGAIYTDSVTISPHPPIPLSIGPDRTKCNNDTLHLSATSSFLNYSWYPNYNINSTTNANVIINPQIDTVYYLKAEKKPGCFAFDTVAIKVNHSAAINLGTDVSFCKDDSAVFDAGSGFTTYGWNTGNTGQFQIAKTPGTYSVVASTVEGCKSSDTVRILSVFQNPVVTLDKYPSICEGTSKQFDAGAGFSSYLWDDGSSGRFRSVQSTGTFFVSVTDQNGCSGTDTTSINNIYPLPQSFLFQDTAICSYGKLDLVPMGSYSKYLWSNNNNSKTITINKPGTYWLQVTDQNNCIGKDTVVVKQKDCMSGFYVPNAFTPKSNSQNNNFKPLLFGNVQKYEFSIFNRWGQMVFHSTELFKGWNGQLAGKETDPGTYVWICVYQFEGEEQKVEKGTVLLIR